MAQNIIHKVDTGLDILNQEGFRRLKGVKVAILSNQASVDKNFRHIIDLAHKNKVNIVKLFAPEHGLYGAMQDMEAVGDEVHPKLKLKIYSLYKNDFKSLSMHEESLWDVDVLLCDLMDIGSRYYTYYTTIAWCMKACERTDTKMMLINRPNPIGEGIIEGNIPKKEFHSVVGSYPLKNRHGMSLGQIISYVKELENIKLDLDIIEHTLSEKGVYLDETDIPFVPPSPNMPNLNAAIIYPGGCLYEGTNLSEGRGTCFPFEIVGASYIKDPYLFKEQILQQYNEGIFLRALNFKPTFQKHAGQMCSGVFIHITDRNKFKPLKFALAVLSVALKYPGFSWRKEAYEFVDNRLAIDLLLGDENLRTSLESS